MGAGSKAIFGHSEWTWTACLSSNWPTNPRVQIILWNNKWNIWSLGNFMRLQRGQLYFLKSQAFCTEPPLCEEVGGNYG